MAPDTSTATLIPIREIRDTIVILKDGSLRAIAEVNAVNFELRSTDEQAAILQQFQGFLNAIDFPLQIVVHSRRFDISEYLATVQTAAGQLTNELMKVQANEYIRFVGELSELSNVMSKRFYVILPFAAIAIETASKGLFGGFKSLFSRSKPSEAGISPEQFSTAQSQLQQRGEIIISGLSGIGLRGHLLSQEELTRLFSELFNPGTSK